MKTRLRGWFLESWKGAIAVSIILLADELAREGYFFKLQDLVVFRPTHEKIVAGLFVLRAFFAEKERRRSHERTVEEI